MRFFMRKTIFFLSIFLFIVVWLFTNSFPIWLNPRTPPKVQEVEAVLAMPSFVQCGSGTGAAGAISPALPATKSVDDIFLLFLETADQVITIAGSNGGTWTEVLNSPQSAAGTTRLTVFWSRYNGTQGDPTTSDSGDHQVGVICGYSGVTTNGNPWDVTSGGIDTVSDTSGSIPGATTTGANRLIVIVGAGDDDADTPITGAVNSSLASISSARANAETSLGNDGGVTVFDGQKSSAGGYGATTLTYTGATTKGMMTIALKPRDPTYAQSAYRFFENDDSTQVGAIMTAVQDATTSLVFAAQAFRLRMLLHIGLDLLSLNGENFKLQFVGKGTGTCDSPSGGTPSIYTDINGATIIAYNNNITPGDNQALTATTTDPTHNGDTIVNQSYEEANNFTNSVARIPSGYDGKWDFSLKDNGADTDAFYCFRVVTSGNVPLTAYNVYPEIKTSAAASISLSLSTTTVFFGDLAPGVPNIVSATTSVDVTGASNGYYLSVKRDSATSTVTMTTERNTSFPDFTAWDPTANGNAGNATSTIADITGKFAFRIQNASTTSNYSTTWWGSNDIDGTAKYAGFPTASQKIMDCSACTSGITFTAIKYRIDSSLTQKNGAYDGNLTFTALVNP